MQVNGIIAEYNPFHNGHKYQLEESLRRTDADFTVVAMSGNFVQRGAPALLDKFVRTQMALRCGADLVLELPSLYATASAEFFAAGAVALLDKLGVVTHLCFGSECGDTALLQDIADILSEESEDFSDTLRSHLRQGLSYPAARTEALMAHYPFFSDHREVFSSPNNILGIEYCKALKQRQSNILPITVKRLGSGYHAPQTEEQFCSAMAIRHALFNGNDVTQLGPHMPEAVGVLLNTHLAENKSMRSNDFSILLYYKLLLEKELGYEKYLDVSADLSDRIRNGLNRFTDFESFCDILKTKDMTHTRISRCLLHILLDIQKEHMELGKSLDYVPYARVLGFRKDSSSLLSAIKENSSIPLVTKLADAEKIVSPDAYKLLQKEIQISEIYTGVAAGLAKKSVPNECGTPIVII